MVRRQLDTWNTNLKGGRFRTARDLPSGLIVGHRRRSSDGGKMTSHRLTPVMQLIINEGLFEVPTPAALTKRLSRGLLKDMFDQALFTLGSWPYEDLTKHPQTNIFRMTLG